jgi:hypothetical protein
LVEGSVKGTEGTINTAQGLLLIIRYPKYRAARLDVEANSRDSTLHRRLSALSDSNVIFHCPVPLVLRWRGIYASDGADGAGGGAWWFMVVKSGEKWSISTHQSPKL